jgi:L-glyceraldehyde 3-phosphate reductase
MISGTLQEQCRALARALEFGITYVDTAPRYGDTQSETSLGRVLKELRVRPIINTKFELMPGQEDDVYAAVMASVDASLQRLGVDYVDSLMVHNNPAYTRPADWDVRQDHSIPFYLRSPLPMTFHEYMGPRGALEALRRVRDAGKIGLIGINRGLQGSPIKPLIATGEFSLLNVPYNLMNPTAGRPKPRWLEVDGDNDDIITYAAGHGMSASIVSPLAAGLLTDRSIADGYRHPLAGPGQTRNQEAYARRLERARSFSFLARDGRTLGQASVQFILGHPGVATVLGGFSAVEQVDEMVGAGTAPPLSEEDLVRIELAWRSNLGERGPK